MKAGDKGLIIFTISCVIGILISTYIGFLTSLILLISGILGCILLGFALTGNLKDSLFLMFIMALGGILGIGLNITSDEMGSFHLREIINKELEVKGIITEEPKISKDKYRITVRVEDLIGEDNNGGFSNFRGEKFLLVVPKKNSIDLRYGDVIKVIGSFELPKPQTNPGGFDYREYLKRQGIGVTMNLWSTKGLRIIGYDPPNWFAAKALKIKNRGNQLISDTMGKEYYPLVQGLIFGDTGEIPEEVNDNFAKLGIIHILSVSGYHMVLIMGIIIFFVSLFPFSRLVRFILIMAGLAFYATMVGWSPPVTRSFIMGLGGLLGYLYKGKYDGKINWSNVLACTILLILCYKPQYLFDLGFQFSFTATWGIIFLTPLIANILNKMKVPSQIQQIVAGTIGAQIATIPIVAYYFNYVSVLTLAANLLTVLLVEIIIILAFISLILGAIFYKLAFMINFSTGIFSWLLLKISSILASIPFAVLYVKQPSYFLMIIFYLLLNLGIWVSDKQFQISLIKYKLSKLLIGFKSEPNVKGRVYSSVTAGVFLVLLCTGLIYHFDNNNNLKVTYLDVGQGDSILITTPLGKNILIDTGGLQSNPDYDIGSKVVATSLLKLGVSKLDLLILTHDHFDHYGGAQGLQKIIKIKKVLVAMDKGEEPYNHLLTLFKSRNIPVLTGYAGEKIDAEKKVKINILSPPKELIEGTESDSNNNSLVLKLTYGSTIFYFTGDIQGEIISQWNEIDPDSFKETGYKKIWKVPHHGSKFSISDNFYKRLNPYLAIISVGKNTFGHPNQEILSELEKNHTKILRTDQLGAISIESDGENINGSWIKKGD